MDDYQKFLIDEFNEFRPQPEYPVYPPYHVGLYLEDYFFNFFIEKNLSTNRYFIPVSWTTCYIQNNTLNLQNKLNSLDLNKKYFTVSQHDDAPKEKLPINTIKFSAGGNQKNCISIPLICNSIPNIKETKKDIFCSFVGSITHPVRIEMLSELVNKNDYILKYKNWSTSVEEKNKDLFLDITSRSIFCLCPRGYGASSFRLYEAMQLKSIPVYIYTDEPYIPFKDDLDWDNIAILIEKKEICDIDKILKSITTNKIKKIREYTDSIYSDYFTLDGVTKQILKYLEYDKNK